MNCSNWILYLQTLEIMRRKNQCAVVTFLLEWNAAKYISRSLKAFQICAEEQQEVLILLDNCESYTSDFKSRFKLFKSNLFPATAIIYYTQWLKTGLESASSGKFQRTDHCHDILDT